MIKKSIILEEKFLLKDKTKENIIKIPVAICNTENVRSKI